MAVVFFEISCIPGPVSSGFRGLKYCAVLPGTYLDMGQR
jgi:hypothetical protein